MLSVSRNVAFVLLAACALVATGCNSNAKKIVGKWKVTPIGDEKDKGEGFDFFVEFKSDNTVATSIVASDPKAQEFVKMMNDNMPTIKWSVNGDKFEFTSNSKGGKGEGMLGKKEKLSGTLKFEGDNLTLTPDDTSEKTVKLVRAK